MKGFKKVLTGILAASLIMCSSLTAFAEDGGTTQTQPTTKASITITPQQDTIDNGDIAEIVYDSYQVLRADVSKDAQVNPDTGDTTTPGTATYYVNTEEYAKVLAGLKNKGKQVFKYDKVNDNRFDIILADESITAKDLIALFDDTVLAAAKKDGLVVKQFKGNGETAATSGDVDPGYYVIKSSLGTVVAIQTLTNVEIMEKNTEIITHKKTSKTNVQVGDKVPYEVEVTIPANTKVNDATKNDSIVILHDKLDSRLNFDDNVTAKIEGVEFAGFTVDTNPNCKDNCTFHVNIPVTDELLGKTIEFAYTATVTERAVDPDTGFINELFGEHNDYKTIPESPEVYDFAFDLNKTFSGTTDDTYFAKFRLLDNDGTALMFSEVKDKNSKLIGYVVREMKDGDSQVLPSAISATEDKRDDDSIIIAHNNQPIRIFGLSAKTYVLREMTTHENYNKVADVNVVIEDKTTDNNGKKEIKHLVNGNYFDANATNDDITIINNYGSTLPSTGGIGTTIFYIIGGLLIVAAVVFFVVRRKADAE